MSSLDDVFEHMRLFDRALRQFNEELRGSAAALAHAHEQTSSLWHDAASARYRQTYDPLAQSLDEYLRASAPRFELFLETKLHQLEQYLNGA